jgi:DNA topoisomerase IA
MLSLKQCATVDDKLTATYEVVHNDESFSTKLTQELEIQICKHTGAITGRLNVADLEAPSFEEGIEKLAIWCDRLANALREPMKVKTSVPVFEKDWDVIHAQESQESQVLGLSFLRLKKIALEKGLPGQEVLSAATSLYENGFITYPKTESAHVPKIALDQLTGTLETITTYLRDLAPLPVINADAAIFDDDRVLTHWAIIPLPKADAVSDRASMGKSENGIPGVSRAEQVVYRIVAEEYIRALATRK